MEWEILYSTKPVVGVKEKLEPIEEMPTEFGIMGFVEPTFGYRSKINELIQRVNLLSAKEN